MKPEQRPELTSDLGCVLSAQLRLAEYEDIHIPSLAGGVCARAEQINLGARPQSRDPRLEKVDVFAGQSQLHIAAVHSVLFRTGAHERILLQVYLRSIRIDADLRNELSQPKIPVPLNLAKDSRRVAEHHAAVRHSSQNDRSRAHDTPGSNFDSGNQNRSRPKHHAVAEFSHPNE